MVDMPGAATISYLADEMAVLAKYAICHNEYVASTYEMAFSEVVVCIEIKLFG